MCFGNPKTLVSALGIGFCSLVVLISASPSTALRERNKKSSFSDTLARSEHSIVQFSLSTRKQSGPVFYTGASVMHLSLDCGLLLCALDIDYDCLLSLCT